MLNLNTPSGKIIELSVTDDGYSITIPEANLNFSVKYPDISKGNLDGNPYPYLHARNMGTNIVFLPEQEGPARSWLNAQENAKYEAREAAIEEKIPGRSELKQAYENLERAQDLWDDYMDRAMETSIGSGDNGNVPEAEAILADLQATYPVAVKYLAWVGRDASTASGYQANLAAKALLNGCSLEEAEKIANNYDVWGI